MCLPQLMEEILMPFAAAFSQPTAVRMQVIFVGIILARGRRTVTNIVWTMGGLATGDCSAYHRVFSRAPWNMRRLGKTLARLLIELVPEGDRVVLAVDDTLAGHKGAKVYGKGCHHDAVRSTHSHTAWRWGHRWVVLAVVVKFPFATRPWSLPVLAALYRPQSLNEAEGRRHKTPVDLARGLLAHLRHWFPERKFLLIGDGGPPEAVYWNRPLRTLPRRLLKSVELMNRPCRSTRDLAAFCHRHRERCALIGKFPADAALYDRPSKRKKTGRPPVRGRRRRSPGQVVADGGLELATVSWYGRTNRQVKLKTASAHWYKAGCGLIPVQWVFVRDETGTRRDEYYFCTQPGLFMPAEIAGYYTQRWTIEVMFQELRTHLGFETPRQRVANSVQRMAPLLLGVFSIVSVLYHRHLTRNEPTVNSRPWYDKTEPTFSDALETARRELWTQTVLAQPHFAKALAKTPTQLKNTLLDFLCQAA